MSQRRYKDTLRYKIFDYLAALIGWTLFFLYRKKLEGYTFNIENLNDINFYFGIAIIPVCWLFFYSIFDEYKDIYRLSRLRTFSRTFFLTLFGVLFLFFSLVLDDFIDDYRTYYRSFLGLFSIHFILTVTVRMVLLTRAHQHLKKW